MKNKMKKNIHQEKVNTVYQNKIIEFIKKGIKNKQYRLRIRQIVKKSKIKKLYDENKEKFEIEKRMLIYILITNELCRINIKHEDHHKSVKLYRDIKCVAVPTKEKNMLTRA